MSQVQILCARRRQSRDLHRASRCSVLNEILITVLPVYPGDVAQLGEHRACNAGVIGSNPFVSTPVLGSHSGRFVNRTRNTRSTRVVPPTTLPLKE